MDWHELPSSARGVVLGVGLALFIGWLTQAAGPALVVLYSCTALGLLVDGVRLWFVWTRVCAWCATRISPFTRNRFFTPEIKPGFWFCSLRCYTEWHRRFHVERKMLNVQFEGNPFENVPSEPGAVRQT